ncbi:hypothetical protein [Paraburkholderia sp. J12]|uniref:CopG family ribbon-helix-helix protein n=1 Tax=Paraburkholderia sp. J12 TaxID=2805432 RepID=UPI002ABDAB73|nr:hypothetical protein [Paraburkholderia sp. J12]
MSDVTFTFRVDATLKSEFATAAKAHDRTVAQLLRDFMRNYVRQQGAAEHDTVAATPINKPPLPDSA